MKKNLKQIIQTGVVLGVIALGSCGISGCSGYNLRMSSIMVDKKGESDLMIGWGSVGKGGSYAGIGILNLAWENPWYSKVTPLINWHIASEAEDKEADNNTTIQLGSLGYAQGSCFQFGYLNFRGNNGNPWYQNFSPLIGWHKEVKENVEKK